MKWCHIFNTGRHTDWLGREKDWTLEDLEKIKFNFESKKLNSPITIGHIKTFSPAYGWVDELKIEGDKLYASFKDLVPEFVEACKKGLFKERSISLDKDLNLRHIAFLGAQAPAIKGLEQFQFQQTDKDIVINFEYVNEKEFMPNSSNEEPDDGAGKALTPSLTKNIKGVEMNLENGVSAGCEMMNFAEAQRELKRTQEENELKDKTIEQLKAELKKELDEKQERNFEHFCDSAIENGHIIPSSRADIIEIMQNLSSVSNFSAEDENNPVEKFKNFIHGLKVMNFQEIANKNNLSSKCDINFEDSNCVKEAIINVQNEYKSKGIELNAIQAFNKIKK